MRCRAADSLHHGIQEVSDSLPRARSDVSSDIQPQVAIRCALRVNGEFSVRYLFLEELQHLSFLRFRKTDVVFDAVFVHLDSDSIPWTQHPPDDVADQRKDSNSDDEDEHRTRSRSKTNSGWLGSTAGSPQTTENWGFTAPSPSRHAVLGNNYPIQTSNTRTVATTAIPWNTRNIQLGCEGTPRRNTRANIANRTEQKPLNAIMPASTRSLPGATVIALVASKAKRNSPHRYQQIEEMDFIAFLDVAQRYGQPSLPDTDKPQASLRPLRLAN